MTDSTDPLRFHGGRVTLHGDWAARIRSAWQASLAGIFECGRLLTEAKEALEHGEFETMIKSELPFKPSTAQRLMKISSDHRLSNPAHAQLLPPHWYTLYELTKLSDEELDVRLSDGTIHPDMQRCDVIRCKVERADNATFDGCTVKDLNSLVSSGKKFAAIMADPPWSFRVYSGKGKQRSADRHYNTASLDDIKALGPTIELLAADDCALFLWAVMPELPGALDVIASWGFTYKTVGFTWIKQNRGGDGIFTGMGYWTRANAELCLLATRGSPRRLAKDVHQIVQSPVSGHSRKPDEVALRIERLVSGPYLELFGRRAAPGWTVWGNEISRNLFQQDIPELQAAE